MDKVQTYKTSLCRHYMNKGVCSLYNNCHFAHGKQQLRSKSDPSPNYVPPVCKPVSIFKTQLCKYYMNGYCRNQLQCPFAHGAIDLHSMIVVSQNPVPIQPPNYLKAGQFLYSILRNFQQVFPQDLQKNVLIKKGLQLVQQNQLEQANDIIEQLMHSATLTEQQKEQCQTILDNALSLHKMKSNNFLHF